MSKGLTGSRIPYVKDCNGKRYDVITGCGNDATICAVRGLGLCWAENLAVPPWTCPEGNPCTGQSCEDYGLCCIDAFKPKVHPEALEAPLRTRKPYTIFTGFGGDMWSEGVDPDWRRQIFEVERQCPQHTFVHLTKRPERIEPTIADVPQWFGTSVTNWKKGETLNTHRLWLRTSPSQHIWASFEPVLGSIEIHDDHLVDFEWVVIGGLSSGTGHVLTPEEVGTRPEHVQSILDAAAKAGCLIYCKNISPIYKQLTNPRTGQKMKSATELREIPESWKRG